MYFIPIQSEKISTSTAPGGDNARSVDNSPEVFDVFLSESMSTMEDQPGYTPAGGIESGRDIVDRPERSHIQVADLNKLDESSKKKIQALTRQIYQRLQDDPRGKELLKKLQQGKLYLLVPVDVQLPGNEQMTKAFLAVHPENGPLSSAGFSVNAFTGLTRNNEAGGIQNPLTSLGVSMFLTAAGKDPGESLPISPSADSAYSAGMFAIGDGAIQFTPAENAIGRISLTLLESLGNSQDSEPGVRGMHQRIRNFVIRQVQLLNQEKANGEVLISSATRGNGQWSNTGVGFREQGIAGEIAAWLESLGGKMRVGGASAKTGVQNTGTQYHTDIVQQVIQSQTQRKAAKISGDGNPGRGAINQSPGDQSLQNVVRQLHQSAGNQNSGQTAGNASHSQHRSILTMAQNSRAQSAGDQIIQSTLQQSHNANFKNELAQMAGLDALSIGGTGPGSADGSSAVTHLRSGILQIIQKIESLVQAAKSHRSLTQPQVMKAHLRLEPKHLGSLQMNLRFHHDTLTGTILASTKDAKALIEQSLPALKNALGAQQTLVQDLEVELAHEFAQDQFADSFLQEFSDNGEPASDNETAFDELQPDGALTGEEHSSIQDEHPTAVPGAPDGWYA